ncbi:MAG TPA: DUF3108 domain-containing protein [Bacteroidota bacterium]|nr:DUF3108 domain-containing protein [Bacteroidota bacterium]
MKKLVSFVCWMLCCVYGFAESHQQNDAASAVVSEPQHVLQVGEEIEYSVHYAFFNIGTIRFQVSGMEVRNGRNVYFVNAYIDSNPSLSWLKELHVKFHSQMDEHVFSYYWLGEDSSSSGIKYTRMKFDYENQKMYYEFGKKLSNGEFRPEKKKTVPLSSHCQDGLSLFFYAREYVHQQKSENVPTYMDTVGLTTEINFQNTGEKKEIDAVKNPVNVVYLDGRADFTGIFGLTGGFEGWFSNDDARIPITAKLKVILGSVRVELTKWKRNAWTPPQAR